MLALTFACATKKQKEEVIYIEEETFDPAVYDNLGKVKLSEYGFFVQPLAHLEPTDNVFPYELNSALFTDYALKKRFIYIPEGKHAKYHDKEVLEFPIGTVLIKNFYYDDNQLDGENGKIIETRLLLHEESGWSALPYIWNEEQTDAHVDPAGFFNRACMGMRQQP